MNGNHGSGTDPEFSGAPFPDCTIGCDLASHRNAAHALMSANSRRGVQTRYMERPRHQAGLDRRPLLAFTYRCCNFASKEASSHAKFSLSRWNSISSKPFTC